MKRNKANIIISSYFRIICSVLLVVVSFTIVLGQVKDNLNYSEGLAALRQDKNNRGAYGFVNNHGKWIISAQYDTVYAGFKNGFAPVGNNRKAGVINKKGKTVIPFEFHSIGEISKSFIAVKSSQGLWGFYAVSGEKIADPLFQNFRYAGKNKIVVQRNSKWGIINHKGDKLIDFDYRWIDQLSDKNFQLWHNNVWSIRNASNKTLVSVRYDSLNYVGDKYFKFSVIGKYGIMDQEGLVIAEPEYDQVDTFRNGLVKVLKSKYGVIDKSNKLFIPFEYDDLIIDSLYIRVMQLKTEDGKLKEKWGLFDLRGNKLISPKYAKMNEYSDGLIAVMKEDASWGYITPKGATEIIFRYSKAENFNHGLAKVLVPYSVLRQEHPAIIDKEGDYVISPADYNFYMLGLIKIDRNKRANYVIPRKKYYWYQKVTDKYIKVEQNGYYGIITTDGKEIIPPIYDNVFGPSENGLSLVEKNGKKGVVDKFGKFTYKLNDKYEKIFPFSEGFAKVMLKGKYGFIDQHGDVYISAQYPVAGDVHDSMVNVTIRDKWGFLDYHENLKVQPYYQEVKTFKNGVALVKENGKWNIVNKQGKQMLQNFFDKISETDLGNYILYNGDKVGLADKKGREVLAPKYEMVREIGNGYLLVKKNGFFGVLDYKENFVLPIEFDQITFIPTLNLFITATTGKKEDVLIK